LTKDRPVVFQTIEVCPAHEVPRIEEHYDIQWLITVEGRLEYDRSTLRIGTHQLIKLCGWLCTVPHGEVLGGHLNHRCQHGSDISGRRDFPLTVTLNYLVTGNDGGG